MQDEYRKAKEKKYISQETPAQAESHEYVSGKPCCRYDLVAVGVRSISLKEKGAEYDATIASLEKQIEEENVRTREIKEFEDYTKTNAYVEQIAHSKLGLVYPDETIFIDKDE